MTESELPQDKHDAEFDGKLAKHIINLHVQGGAAVEREVSEDELDVRTLKRYIVLYIIHIIICNITCG